MKVLVTGGAGFIGSHLVDKLVITGNNVTILDNLSSNEYKLPDYLNSNSDFILGDVKDSKLLKKIIPDFDVIFHEAASVGISQSNYEINKFIKDNTYGTSNLLQAVIDTRLKPRLIIATSNTTYGEGLYYCDNCGANFHPPIRSEEDIRDFGFEPACGKCKSPGKPVPTPESTELYCNSVYAYTKKHQEELSIHTGKMYNFPVIALKYFNVYGPRQSLSNPYTGVSAIFISRIKNSNPAIIYEDGLQTRDFISVHDIVDANILAMNSKVEYGIFNIGSGKPVSIKNLAESLFDLFNVKYKIEITNKFRKGDIRHCIADNTKAKEILGWSPNFSFEQGLKEVYEWSKSQESNDKFKKASQELKERGLIDS